MGLDGATCRTSAHAELSPARRGEAPRPREVVRRYRRLRIRSAREGLAQSANLNLPNRRMRTRMSGGVAGE